MDADPERRQGERRKDHGEWLTPQLVSLMAGEGWTAVRIRECVVVGQIQARRQRSGWLIHRAEAERFVASVSGSQVSQEKQP